MHGWPILKIIIKEKMPTDLYLVGPFGMNKGVSNFVYFSVKVIKGLKIIIYDSS